MHHFYLRMFYSPGVGIGPQHIIGNSDFTSGKRFQHRGAIVKQTYLVYADPNETLRLSETAILGRRLWQKNNCQSCHQLYGYGGFLGPDLTNASVRVEPVQFTAVLTEGVEQMPAFNMSPEEIDALGAFLSEMNETGTGQARRPVPPPVERPALAEGIATAATPGEALRLAVTETGDEQLKRALGLLKSRSCLTCHVPFAVSSVQAPDLSLVSGRLEPKEIMTVLRKGKQPKMPPPALKLPERQAVQSLIIYMGEHRDEILARVVPDEDGPSFWGTLPWWAYP